MAFYGKYYSRYETNKLKLGGKTMTSNQFQSLCGKYLIDVGIALESQELKQLLRDKASEQEIETFLQEQF